MMPDITAKLSARQRGDFQTPQALARQIWAALDLSRFDLIIEPTFGLGAFLMTIPENSRADVVGWEIHGEYYHATVGSLATGKTRSFRLYQGDILAASRTDIGAPSDASLLVIGNPPWVTNAEQGALGGGNTGRKYNLKSLPGLEALTGKSNFDISEAIILHLIGLVSGYTAVQFALLGKFTVVRNLMQFLGHDSDIGDFEFHRINSLTYFGAAVDAGLIKFKIGKDITTRHECTVYHGIAGDEIGRIGLLNGRLVYDLEAYERTLFLENANPPHYVWRQGVKHDASKILELSASGAGLRNRQGELVEVEPEVLYPLYKSSDIFHGRESRFALPLYQRGLHDPLGDVERRFPKLYDYLKRHEAVFRARESSIYRKRPPFSMFGIGDYTYATYKVAIGALYAEPVFRLLEPAPRPAVLDDTCYMLATNDYGEAVYLLAILSLDCTRDFLLAVSYSGDKRRFSKEVLAKVLIPPVQDCPEPLYLNQLPNTCCQESLVAPRTMVYTSRMEEDTCCIQTGATNLLCRGKVVDHA